MDHVCVRRSQRHKRKPLRYQAIEKVTKIPQKRFYKTKSTNIKCMYNEIIYKLRYLQKVIKLKNQETENQETEKKNKIGIGEMVPVYFKSLNKQTNMLYKMVKQLKIMLILREYEQQKEQEQQQQQQQEQEQEQGQEQKQEKEQQKEEQTTITV